MAIHTEVCAVCRYVFKGYVRAVPQRFGSVRHFDVFENYVRRAAEGFGGFYHAVGKADAFGVPHARAGGRGKASFFKRGVF